MKCTCLRLNHSPVFVEHCPTHSAHWAKICVSRSFFLSQKPQKQILYCIQSNPSCVILNSQYLFLVSLSSNNQWPEKKKQKTPGFILVVFFFFCSDKGDVIVSAWQFQLWLQSSSEASSIFFFWTKEEKKKHNLTDNRKNGELPRHSS